VGESVTDRQGCHSDGATGDRNISLHAATMLVEKLAFKRGLDNKNKLNGTYVYRHKHNYIPYSTFTITKVQLHVSAINVGHLQVVHEAQA